MCECHPVSAEDGYNEESLNRAIAVRRKREAQVAEDHRKTLQGALVPFAEALHDIYPMAEDSIQFDDVHIASNRQIEITGWLV